MSNKITTTGISDPSIQQPWLGPSLEFLQLSRRDDVQGVCRTIMGETNFSSSTSRGIAMSGCTFAGGLNTFFTGYIFFNGELYKCPGATGLLSYVNVPVVILSDVPGGPDPITMSDSSTQSVHRVRTLVIADQVSGTGLFDLSNLLYVPLQTKNQITLSTYASVGTGVEAITGATFTVPPALTAIKRKYRVTIIGNMYYPIGGVGSSFGSFLYIRNSTTSTNLAQNVTSLEGNAAITGLHMVAPISVSVITPSLDPGTVIIGAMQDTNGNSRSFLSGQMFYEEVNL